LGVFGGVGCVWGLVCSGLRLIVKKWQANGHKLLLILWWYFDSTISNKAIYSEPPKVFNTL